MLGWDVYNNNGDPEQYKDVVIEGNLKIEDPIKNPDYTFRIGGQRKFFVEAKKPYVDIKNDVEPSFHLRHYGYSAGLPLSILTDFEEFAVYDTRIKPINNDPPSKGRIFYCTYKDYVNKFDYIKSIFSREAILKGSFDIYANKNKN